MSLSNTFPFQLPCRELVTSTTDIIDSNAHPRWETNLSRRMLVFFYKARHRNVKFTDPPVFFLVASKRHLSFT